MSADPKRVVIWGTGFVGKMVIPEVVRHPGFELVGVGVSNPDKVGRDAGELCGIDALGALRPDALVHYGPTAAHANENIRDMGAFLRAGIDVCSTAMTPWVWPTMSLNPPSWVDPISEACAAGGSSCFIPQGRIYALDEHGKLMWPGPVTIEDQYFLLNQPERLPVITFACQRYDQRANGQWWPKTRILCLDKRTGRVVYRPHEGTSRQNVGLEVVGDPKKKTVELQIIAMDQSPRQVDTVTLTFTDKPIPETAADKDAVGEKAKHTKLGDALLDSLDKSIDGVMP